MKKTILMIFAVAIASVNMIAQSSQNTDGQKKTPEERTNMMIKKMTQELVLTPDQQTKMKALILKREQDREVRMKEEKARMEKTDAEIKTILTQEQYQKFEQKKSEMKQNREKKHSQLHAK